MKGPHTTERAAASGLCLTCGLCCNGVLFTDVKLQPGDDSARLRGLGITLVPSPGSKGNLRFKQPCSALEGCSCRIYAERPSYCRQFECALLQGVMAGRLKPAEARETIRQARRQLERIEQLIQDLGDQDNTIALRERFRRLGVRLAAAGLGPDQAQKFSALSLAMHDLYLLVRQAFYP